MLPFLQVFQFVQVAEAACALSGGTDSGATSSVAASGSGSSSFPSAWWTHKLYQTLSASGQIRQGNKARNKLGNRL